MISLFFLNLGITGIIVLIVYLHLLKKINTLKKRDLILEDIRDDVQELVIEINQTTDRNITLLEDRIGKVNDLLKQADKRIKLLDRRKDTRKTEVPVYNDIDVSRLPVNRNPGKKSQVLKLYKNGFSPGIIASKVGTSVGEVELIISLEAGKEVS